MTTETIRLISFDDVRVEPRTGMVFKAGTPLQLEPKGFRLLMFLIENRERLVEKAEILDVVWKGTIVTEYALTGAIAKLRKAIGDDTKTPKYIQTVHTRGYRFIAAVELEYASETNGGGEKATATAGAPDPDVTAAGSAAVPGTSFLRLILPRSLALAAVLGVLILGARLLWNTSGQTTRSAPSSAIRSLAVLPFQLLSSGRGVDAALRRDSGGQKYQQPPRRYTDDPEAYLAFLRAHYFMNKATKEGLAKGIEYFQQAIDRDPKYAMAYAGLADCYRKMEGLGVAPAEFVPKSRAAVMKALEIDDTVAYAHSMLGLIAYKYDWDFDKANREYKRAQELDPTLVHQWYGSYLQVLNRTPEAEIEFKRFADSQPFLPLGNTIYGQYFFLTRQYDRAFEQIRHTLEMDANYAPARETLGLVYEQQGRPDEAIKEFQTAIALSHGEYGLGSLGHIYAEQGRGGDVHKVLQLLAERSRHAYVSPYEMALVFAGLGQNDQALECLKKAYTERSLSAPFLEFDPRLAKVREGPRFEELVRGMGLSFHASRVAPTTVVGAPPEPISGTSSGLCMDYGQRKLSVFVGSVRRNALVGAWHARLAPNSLS